MEESVTVRQDVDVLEKSSTRPLSKRIRIFTQKNRLFVWTVIVPTFISLIYYGLIASDVYISESQFVVRSSKQSAPSGLGLLFGASFSNSQIDGYSVAAFVLSRDALQKLNTDLVIDKMFSDKKIDVFSRFGVLPWRRNFEAFHEYYQKHVSIYLDTTSSITSLSVSAYDPREAYNLNEHLIQAAEKHVNQLNERARQDQIQYASDELHAAELAAQKATQALVQYRENKRAFDPAYFERLMVVKGITIKELEVRHAALVQANSDSRRKYLYLERIAGPHLPDYPVEPRRLRYIFSTIILAFIIWGILSMLLAGVREHHD